MRRAAAGGVVPQPLGLSASLATYTGNNNAWTQRTFDLSIYATHTIRLVWRVVVGTTGFVYENDLQLDTIAFDGNAANFDSGDDGFTCMQAGVGLAYDGGSWVAIQADNTADYWCRDSGGTTSTGTGRLTGQSGSFYLYTEASAPVVNADAFWLRSPQIVCSAAPGNATFYEGRDVSGTTTTLDFYVDVDAQP